MTLRIAQSIVLILYGLMIGFYYFAGKLAFLVNPFYNNLILAGGIFVFLVGGYMFLTAKRFPGHQHSSSFSQWMQWGLLALPLIFTVVFIPQPLSSQSALVRGVTQDLSTGEGISPIAFGKPPQERTLTEWVRILNYDPEPDHHAGQPVEIEAMVLVHDELPENYFYLSQFLLTCCAADARSVVLPVHYDPGQFTPISDQWIRLEGQMAEGELEGHRQGVIEYVNHQEIEVPENPYAE